MMFAKRSPTWIHISLCFFKHTQKSFLPYQFWWWEIKWIIKWWASRSRAANGGKKDSKKAVEGGTVSENFLSWPLVCRRLWHWSLVNFCPLLECASAVNVQLLFWQKFIWKRITIGTGQTFMLLLLHSRFTSLMPFFGCLSYGSFMVSEWKIAVLSCVLVKSAYSACNWMRCGYKSGPGWWAKQWSKERLFVLIFGCFMFQGNYE